MAAVQARPRRMCLGCRELGPWGKSGRCPACARLVRAALYAQPERVAKKAQLYTKDYRRVRRLWVDAVDKGWVSCARCGAPIVPGSGFDLDHLPIGGHLHPSHQHCNRAAGGRGE